MMVMLLSGSWLAMLASADSSVQNPRLRQLFADDWQARLTRFPEMASSMGDKTAANKLFDASAAAHQRWLADSQALMTRLQAIDPQTLVNSDRISYQIFAEQLNYRISQLKFKSYQIPFLSDSGFHTSILDLAQQGAFKTIEDFTNYLSRLEAIPAYFEQHKSNMRDGLKRNFSMPAVVMRGFSEVIDKQVKVSLEDNPLWAPFKDMSRHISTAEQEKLKLRAARVIQDKVQPAFLALYDFFEQAYIPNTRVSLGAYQLPQGKAYYASQVEHYTTLKLSAGEIHALGLQEVARIRKEMEAIIEELEFEGSFRDFLKFLRESPQFYAKTAEDLLKEAAYIAKKMDGQLPKFFTRLPRQPYTVEPVPASIAPKYTTGRYVSAPLDSTRPGTYWVNTYALDKRPLYVLESLTLHEAVPGHHLQGALNKELTNLPNFRRYSYISAFGEGWGLYCERLGLEAGFYQDPYSNFGRLTYEMWRAARLVIDTGIHAMGWSRERAIKLLEENSALSTHNIRTEVDRYISWPGQALSYKLGELKIRELRKKAETKLGEKFDIRLFHDEVLRNGSIPLAVLEQQIDQFIKRSFNEKQE